MRPNSTMHIMHAEVHPSVSRVQFNQMAISEDNKYFVRFLLKLFKHKQLFGNPLTLLELQNPQLWPKHPGKSLWLCNILQNMACCGLSFLLSTPKKSGWNDLPYNTVCRTESSF